MYVKKNSWVKHLDFILADLLCINLTLLIAYFLRNGVRNVYALKEYRTLLFAIMAQHFCISFFSNTYSDILRRGYFQEFKRVLVHNTGLMLFIMVFMFFTHTGAIYSRLMIFAFWVMDIFTMYFVHICLKTFLRKRDYREKKQTKLLIITTPENMEKVISEVNDGPDKSFEIVGVALNTNEEGIKECQGIPVVSEGTDMYDYVCKNVVDEVLLNSNYPSDNFDQIVETLVNIGITVDIKLNIKFNGGTQEFGHINDTKIIRTSANTVTITEMALKRAMDICAGVVGCLVTGILFIFVAPAIKIADPKGPVFFGQKRVGRNGRTFTIYKFRSMYVDAEERKKELMEKNKMEGLMFKMDADPRIIGSGPDGTRKGLGYYLRHLSIDEFPNFWSILKGDMSLVGTRPPTMDEYNQYELHHKSRLAAKPGLTGMWQVSGRSDFTDFEEIVKMDSDYIKNWNIGLDIKIILKTVLVVLGQKGSV